MALFPGPANAVVYAQFVLQGRWRRILIASCGYGLFVGGMMLIATLGSTHHFTAQDYMSYLGVLAGLQVVTLLIFGTFRIDQAVRGDVSSGMIESHRLMPTSPLRNIFGYLIGAPLQPYALSAVNFLLGAACCALAGLPMRGWLLINVGILLFSLFIFTIVMQYAFVGRGGFLLFLLIGGFLCSAGINSNMEAVPSLKILLYPLLPRESIFEQVFSTMPTAVSSQLYFGCACSILSQAIIAAVAIRVAVRRYVSSSMVGISPPLGLILLATWVAMALAGFFLNDSYSYRQDVFAGAIVSSFATAMLLAIVPIASAARSTLLAEAMPGQRRASRLSPIWTLLAAAAILSVILTAPFIIFTPWISRSIAPTLIVIVSFLVSMSCLFYRGYLGRGRPWIVVCVWVFITWIGPVAGDAVYRVTGNINEDATFLTGFSPPGALALSWSGSMVPVQPGLTVQIALAVLAAGLLLLTRNKVRNAKSMASAAERDKGVALTPS